MIACGGCLFAFASALSGAHGVHRQMTGRVVEPPTDYLRRGDSARLLREGRENALGDLFGEVRITTMRRAAAKPWGDAYPDYGVFAPLAGDPIQSRMSGY